MTVPRTETHERSISTDVIVVGAGPAGLAAAVTVADAGQHVAVVDLNAQTGGQYWRHAPEHGTTDPDGHGTTDPDGHGHHDWDTYTALRRRFFRARDRGLLTYLTGVQVWSTQRSPDGDFIAHLAPTPEFLPVGSGAPDTVAAPSLILCTGAYDRQLPVPGWDLPGVMAAGGIQASIKVNGYAPGRRFVVAGTGPFLLSVAAGIADAGGSVAAVCESSSLTRWAPHLGAAARVPAKGLEGVEYAATFLRHRIPYRTRTVVTQVLGDDHVTGVRIASVDGHGRVRPGTERTVADVDVVGFGWGFTPQLELPVALGAETQVDVDGSLVCTVDESQQSTVPGLFLAGEITGVGGAALAVAEGCIAGAAAAGTVQAPPQACRARRIHRRFAAGMHDAHPVPQAWSEWLTPETTVCRCEEVPCQALREAAASLGVTDSRSAKAITRTGMGWCQGRVCGFAASCLTADAAEDTTHQSLLSTAKRPLSAPIDLGRLAVLDDRRRPVQFPDTPHFSHPIREEPHS